MRSSFFDFAHVLFEKPVSTFSEHALGPQMRVESYSLPERHVARSASSERPIADVCLIVEGAYPYVSGGVSSWVHGLIRRQPDLRFCVVAILPEPPAPVAKYGGLPNLAALHHLYLTESYGNDGW